MTAFGDEAPVTFGGLAHDVVDFFAGVVEFGGGPVRRAPATGDGDSFVGEVFGFVVVVDDKGQVFARDAEFT